MITRLAANLTERNDWGEHDDESGSGIGGGIGWRRYLGEVPEIAVSTRPSAALATGWHFGLRVDYWDLEIDWRDPGGREGTTDIKVLQPTAEFGYGWSSSRFGRLEATLGLGAEINIHTEGEEVGEGAIVLFGVAWIP